jgi:hypothetical protein
MTGLMPVHFLHALRNLTLWGQNSVIGTNPAAGPAFNTALGVDLMNLMTLAANRLGGAWAHAGLAAATVVR